MRRKTSKQWNLLFYMSIGKGLEKELDGDLEALQNVGSGKDVNVVVQCREPKTRKPANRYQLWNGSRERYSSVSASRANLGDPQTLVRFVKWADDRFPADKTFLIMWGHGYGVHSIFGYELDEEWLEIPELAQALQQLERERGKKLEVLGFDACNMQTVEVAYQLRNYVKFTVGSPVGTPETAWQYAELLKNVKAKPRSYPKTVARMVLKCMNESKNLDDQTILSVLDLGKSDELVGAIAALAQSLETAYGSYWKRKKAAAALQKAAWVDCRQLPDLGDVCEKLKKDMAHAKVKLKSQREQTNARRVRRKARAVVKLLDPGGFVVEKRLTDKRLRTPWGVSIYVPKIKVRGKGKAESDLADDINLDMTKTIYRNLEFTATATDWMDWVYSLPVIEERVEDPCLWFRQTPCPRISFTT
jgi:hypothetical protein